MLTCSGCNASNITQCTSCAMGLQLIDGACISCSANCLSCFNGQCQTCKDGLLPNSNGVCVLACVLPCLSCVDNQPSVCLSCQSGSALVNGTCQLSTACNSFKNCTNCGFGLNFVLLSGQCVACPSNANCLQCSALNTSSCQSCVTGYYVVSGTCSKCVSPCLTCSSAIVCTSCVDGFTLPA